MGSCVSKKVGAGREGKAAAPLPPVKEINALSPVAEEEEEVKEVVLSETPAPRLPRTPPVEKRQDLSEAGSESASVGSIAKEKAMGKDLGEQEVVKRALDAHTPEKPRGEQEVVKRAVDAHAPEKVRARRTASPEKSKPKPKQCGASNGSARSPSPSSAQRRQPGGLQQPPPPTTRPRREPAVVSGIGCRSGRFSPSAARRAAESAIRRTNSAREADMSVPAKRSLNASINVGRGNPACFGGTNTLSRRDPGERSDSPTQSKRPSPSPSPIHRQARRAARENYNSTPERSRPRVRDVGANDTGRGGDEQPASAGGNAGGGGGEHKKKPGEDALGQNPSVAMECFIFL